MNSPEKSALLRRMIEQSPMVAALCLLFVVFIQPQLDRIEEGQDRLEVKLERLRARVMRHLEEPELHHSLRTRLDILEGKR